MTDYETTWDTFWKELCEVDGKPNMDAIKRELHDYHQLMDNAAKVYCHITNNLISKTNTDPDAVIGVADEVTNRACAEAIEEMKELEQETGAGMIMAERARHVTGEGWLPEHDDEHTEFELSRAAINYAKPMICSNTPPGSNWPWNLKWWKPSNDLVRNLVKAGALIAAEIDRLKRKNK